LASDSYEMLYDDTEHGFVKTKKHLL